MGLMPWAWFDRTAKELLIEQELAVDGLATKRPPILKPEQQGAAQHDQQKHTMHHFPRPAAYIGISPKGIGEPCLSGSGRPRAIAGHRASGTAFPRRNHRHSAEVCRNRVTHS